MTYDQLLQTVQNYFNDTSRTAEETKVDLSTLRDEIEMLIESLG